MHRQPRLMGRPTRGAAIVSISMILATVSLLVVSPISAAAAPRASSMVRTPNPKALLESLTRPRTQESTVVGPGGLTMRPFVEVKGRPIILNPKKPELLFEGFEYCPFCAPDAWSLIMALSRFGTFTGLKLIRSSSDDVYPDTRFFTFYGSVFRSPFVDFKPLELESLPGRNLQRPRGLIKAVIDRYNVEGGAPFVYLNGRTVPGALFSPSILHRGNGSQAPALTFAEIRHRLNHPNGAIAKNIIGAANWISALVCDVDGMRPLPVCGDPSIVRLSRRLGGVGPR